MAANYITDQKGRYLPTAFAGSRDGHLGDMQVLESQIDLSLVGSQTAKPTPFTLLQTLEPNSNLGLGAGDSIDVMVLPENFQVTAVHFMLDTNAPYPDILPVSALTVATFNIGDACVLQSDGATVVSPAGYTPSPTAYATGQAITAAGSSVVYNTGTRFLPYIGATFAATPYQYVLRLTVNTLTGASNIKQGKFRLRVAGIVFER